jgi:DNA-binding response OmpR family regulator
MNRPNPAKIVLAEADSGVRSSYATNLRQAGHEVWEAEDGGRALELVRTHRPELLIISGWLPILNGSEVLERLVGVPESVGLKVVMLTKERDADTRLEGFALGVSEYWSKDLSAAELDDRTERLIGPCP